jgi:peptidyl-tRNA hydrolase
MKLTDVPIEFLEKGDRVQANDIWNQGTIHALDVESRLIAIRWDTGRVQEDIAFNDILEHVTYQGRWKMYCLVSEVALKAMGGNRGKLGAQTGHGYQFADWDAQDRFPAFHIHYRKSMHSAKVCLKVADEAALKAFYEAYRPIAGAALIKDAAHTVFSEPTYTTCGIGPIRTDRYGDMRADDLRALRPLI